MFQSNNFDSFRVVTHVPLTVFEFCPPLHTFTIKRTAASGMELWIGSISRSLSLKGSRLCGDLGAMTANTGPFSGLHLTLLLIFFFYRNLLEQGTQERVAFATLPTCFPTICSTAWMMLLHYPACIDGCRACVSCFCSLVWEVCSLSCRWII